MRRPGQGKVAWRQRQLLLAEVFWPSGRVKQWCPAREAGTRLQAQPCFGVWPTRREIGAYARATEHRPQLVLCLARLIAALRPPQPPSLRCGGPRCPRQQGPWPSTSIRAGGKLASTRSLRKRTSPALCQGEGPRRA